MAVRSRSEVSGLLHDGVLNAHDHTGLLCALMVRFGLCGHCRAESVDGSRRANEAEELVETSTVKLFSEVQVVVETVRLRTRTGSAQIGASCST
jgi:hypothetical protein